MYSELWRRNTGAWLLALTTFRILWVSTRTAQPVAETIAGLSAFCKATVSTDGGNWENQWISLGFTKYSPLLYFSEAEKKQYSGSA